MTHVIKATFPSSPEERNFIKNLKWPKLLTNFYKTFEYTFSNNSDIKYKMCGFTSLSNFDNHLQNHICNTCNT